MNGFLIRRRYPGLLAGVVVIALSGLMAPPLAAQQESGQKPLRLIPPKALQPPAARPADGKRAQPAPATPAKMLPAAGRVLGPRSQTQPQTGVQVDSLRTIESDAAGTLTPEQGGFGDSMWKGTGRALVDTLLPRLPVNVTSPAMRDLMRRLLLSAATAPEGEAEKGGLVALRIRLLAAMGDLEGVNSLLDATPGRAQIEHLARIEADTRFLANDNARACALATAQIGRRQSAFWQKAFIFCQTLAGEHDKAALGVALLREMGEKDAVFFTLVDALFEGGTATVESLPEPSPLHLTMARAAKARLPADVIASNQPAVLRTIAISPNAPVELRLDAAERAEAAGALPIDILRQLYTSVSFSEEELANPLSKAEAESGPLSRALLYRTALVQTVPTAQAEAAGRALALAREGGRYASTVRAFMPVLKQIRPSEELLWFAPEAVRAFLISGEGEAARVWFGLLRASALFNQDSRAMLTALLPLARLANSGEADDWTTEKLIEWWKAADGGDQARRHAALLYTLFESLGEPVPTPLWDALLDGPQRVTVAMPRPALWQRLAGAVDAMRVGETVLLSLLALGEGGPAEANPVVLRRVLLSLRGVGLETTARRIALEAAVAAGI